MSVTEFIQPPPSSAAPPDDPRRWAILATVCLALILIVIDNTILNVALPTIQRELDASSSELQWMVDTYVLVFAGLLLLAGAIGDRFGKRGALTGGLAVFGVGSLMATFVGDAGSLVATRGLMGIGAAFIMPATLSILIDVFQRPDERAKAIGIWSAVAGLGLILGPVVGGWLVEHVSWQAVFAVNVPLVVVAVGLVARLVPMSKRDDHAQLDLVGAGLSVGALGLTLYGIIEAPSNGLTAASTVVAVGVGVALAIAFVVWESSTPHPMLPLEFFRNPTFAGGAGAIGVTFFGIFGAMFLSTQYFQSVQGYSGFEAGVRTLPIGVIIVAAPLSAKLAQRVGAGPVVATGMGGVAAGLLLAGRFAPDSSYFPHIVSALILLGVGMGMIVAPATEAVMSSVPASRAGVGSAVNDTVREVGGAFGIAVLGSITASVYRSRVDELGAGDGLTAEQAAHVRDGVGGALHAAAGMDPDIGGPVVDAARLAYTDAAGRGFTIAAVVLAAGALVLGWAMRGGPGRSQRSHSDRPGHELTVRKSDQHHQKGSIMTTRTNPRFKVAALAVLVISIPAGAALAHGSNDDSLDSSEHRAVRQATEQYRDVDDAIAAGYIPSDMCTELPGVGGMGYHFVNPALVADPAVDLASPEILLYNRAPNGELRLDAVEWFVADADQDPATDADRPFLAGHPFDGPMPGHGQGMPVHYDLHAWVYKHNPNGELSAWNPKVVCD